MCGCEGMRVCGCEGMRYEGVEGGYMYVLVRRYGSISMLFHT